MLFRSMFNHKADFVLRYNMKFEEKKDINDFDWSQSRIIFISTNFTKYQINSINFKDLPIELWKIKRYNNNTISFEQILSVNSNESIKTIAPVFDSDVKQEVFKSTKTYSERDLLDKASSFIIDIYNELKDYILSLDDNIIINPTKLYIGFNRSRKSIISIKPQKNSIILWINAEPQNIIDPQGIIKDVTNIGHHGNGNSQIKIIDNKNIGYIEDLLKTYVSTL